MENLTAAFRNTSAKTLEKAKVMYDYLGPQETEVKVGNKQTANSFHCFLLQTLLQVQLPWNFMSSVSLPSSAGERTGTPGFTSFVLQAAQTLHEELESKGRSKNGPSSHLPLHTFSFRR